MPKVTKADPDKVEAEIKNMQQELKALEEALGQLVDAMITEEKPGLKEIKKLRTLKKKAQNERVPLEKVSAKHKSKATLCRTEKKSCVPSA